jgi:RNA polymerase sigma-70 factor (ECF subfamily)
MQKASSPQPVSDSGGEAELLPGVIESLVQNHRRFLSFLERRVGSPALAEELLQSAYVRTLEKGGELQEGEGAVAWFYRLLRNALVDHYRRSAAESRALEREAQEASEAVEPELKQAICACIHDLLPALKPEYAELVRQVDLGGPERPRRGR